MPLGKAPFFAYIISQKITGQCFSTKMKATCKNSANLEQTNNNQNRHLSPFITSFFKYYFNYIMHHINMMHESMRMSGHILLN